MLWYVMSLCCVVILCYFVLFYVMLRYVILFYFMLFYTMFFFNYFMFLLCHVGLNNVKKTKRAQHSRTLAFSGLEFTRNLQHTYSY